MKERVTKTEIKLEDYEHFLENPFDEAFSYQQLNQVFYSSISDFLYFLFRLFGCREKEKEIRCFSFSFPFFCLVPWKTREKVELAWYIQNFSIRKEQMIIKKMTRTIYISLPSFLYFLISHVLIKICWGKIIYMHGFKKIHKRRKVIFSSKALISSR